MDRFLLPAVVVLVMLALAPSASAQGLTTLYSSMDAPDDVQGINSVPVGPSFLGDFRYATTFTPTKSGSASLLSMRGQCVINFPTTKTCDSIGEVSVQADVNGKPSGTSLGTMGFYLVDALQTGDPVRQQCGTLAPRVQLNAGTKYWAVMSAPEGIGWLYSKQAATETVLESVDGGPWSTPPIATKTLALRIDAGFDACVPKAKTIPAPGETLGDMYVRTGHTAFNTISIENIGVAPLTWSGATFSGPDASVFSLFDQMSQAAPRFPRQIGVGGGLRIIEVRCTGGAQERWYRATLTFHTNDPTTPDQAFQVKCLVDNTPPNVTHHVPSPDGKNGWYVTQIPVTVNAIDPGGENASGVKQTSCGRGDERWFFWGGVQTVTLTQEGHGSMGCTAEDLAGNVGSGNFGNFALDTRRPSPVPVYEPVPTAYGWNNTATKLSFNCVDPTPGSGVELPATGGGTVTTETPGTDFTSGGCTDIAGWVSIPVTSTVRIDMTRPRITFAGLTPAPNAAGWNRSDVTVAWNCDDTGSVQSGIATDEVPDVLVTQETASRRVTSSGTCADKAANTAAHIQQEVKLDKTAPTTTVDGPPAATNATSAELSFAGADALSGVKRLECKVDNGEYSTCESPLHVSDLADGSHTLSVRAVDVADNVDATPATHTWTVDTVAPNTGILTGPNGPTASKSAAFTYQGDTLGGTAIAGYECRIDDGAWGACVDYTGLAEGEHRFEVRAIDAAGNIDGSPATRTWTVDTIAPDTAIESGPDALTNSRSASFTYSGGDRYECKLDGGAWGECRAYENLADGDHRFEVRAVDAAGNTDDSPAAHTWMVDTVAPDTTIGSGPAAITSARSASFTYSGGDRVECRLDDGDWAACRDTYTDLADGDHRLQARAVDNAGNHDESPASHSWTIDTVAPETTIDSGPDAVTRSRSASFTYGGGSGYECRLDDAAWAACPAGYAGLDAGEHQFRIRASDAAGNIDDSPAVQTWTIDLTAPTTTLTDKPRARDWDTTARFRLTAADAGGSTVAGIECRLDGQPFGPCKDEWRDLAEGDHTFEARAADAVGNVEDPPVAYTWTVRQFRTADDEATTREDTPVTIDVAANDVRPSTGTTTLAPDATSAQGGTVAREGETKVSYTPAAGFNGTDTFRYSLTNNGETLWGTVTVRVDAVEDPVAIRAESAIVVDEDSGPYRAPYASASFELKASRPELFSAAPAVDADGSLTFTPAPDAYGTATVAGGPAPLTITIRPIDDAPRVTVARDVRCGRSNNGTFRLSVVDIDSDGSTLKISGSSSSRRVGLAFGHAGNSRTISITRKPGLRRATVTVRAVDGDHRFQTRVHLAVGTARADRLRGTAGPDLLFGLGGADTIAGRGGDDLICGGAGNDRLDGGAGNDVVIGGRGDDQVGGGAGNDVLRGDTGADRLVGGAGDDELRGGPRGDVFSVEGNDRLVDFNARRGDVR